MRHSSELGVRPLKPPDFGRNTRKPRRRPLFATAPLTSTSSIRHRKRRPEGQCAETYRQHPEPLARSHLARKSRAAEPPAAIEQPTPDSQMTRAKKPPRAL